MLSLPLLTELTSADILGTISVGPMLASRNQIACHANLSRSTIMHDAGCACGNASYALHS